MGFWAGKGRYGLFQFERASLKEDYLRTRARTYETTDRPRTHWPHVHIHGRPRKLAEHEAGIGRICFSGGRTKPAGRRTF